MLGAWDALNMVTERDLFNLIPQLSTMQGGSNLLAEFGVGSGPKGAPEKLGSNTRLRLNHPEIIVEQKWKK